MGKDLIDKAEQSMGNIFEDIYKFELVFGSKIRKSLVRAFNFILKGALTNFI